MFVYHLLAVVPGLGALAYLAPLTLGHTQKRFENLLLGSDPLSELFDRFAYLGLA